MSPTYLTFIFFSFFFYFFSFIFLLPSIKPCLLRLLLLSPSFVWILKNLLLYGWYAYILLDILFPSLKLFFPLIPNSRNYSFRLVTRNSLSYYNSLSIMSCTAWYFPQHFHFEVRILLSSTAINFHALRIAITLYNPSSPYPLLSVATAVDEIKTFNLFPP